MRWPANLIPERRYGVTHLLPTPEAWAAAMARADEVAKNLVSQGYRVVGHGKNWKVVQDLEKVRVL